MKLFQQGDFRLDPNTTPEMLKAKRERLAALMPQYGKAQYIGEGLTQLLHGIGSGRSERAMDAFQGERSAEAAQQFAAATGGPMSILGMRPQEQGASFTQDPNAPESIGSDTMAALGKPSNGGGPDAIRQGLISRGLPEYVADGFMMNFRDESGFDPGINEIAPTVPGSRGGFGLAQWTGPRRRALESFAAQQGADIADPNLQLDFLMTELQGPEAGAAKSIFAAQDSGEAAAAIVNDFLRPADEHRKSRTARYTGGQGYSGGAPATGQPMQGGQDMDALLQAQANPWLTQSQRAVLDGMISQRQSQQAAAEDRYWRQNDPAYQQGLVKGQLEIDAMRNPAPEKGTSDMQEYQYAQSQGYQGTFQDYMMGMKKAGATSVNVGGDSAPGLGKLSTDYGYVLDPATGMPKIDPTTGLPTSAPIPGSPAAIDAEKAKLAASVKRGNAAVATDIVTTAASRAREAAGVRELGGLGSSLMAAINPYSDSAEVGRQVEVLKSNAKIEALGAMRAASPTGGALGSVTDSESAMLASKAGALDPTSPNFVRDLDDYERSLLRIIHGKEAGDLIYEQTRAPQTGATGDTNVPDAEGWIVKNGVKMRVKQ